MLFKFPVEINDINVLYSNWNYCLELEMEYLSLDEIREKQSEIRGAFDRLMENKALVNRPGSKQWRFFRACLNQLLGSTAPMPFDTLDRTPAAQYKFEVEDKLARFYQRPGVSQPFVFSLCHRSNLNRFGFFEEDEYPTVADYCLLVRDLAGESFTQIETDKASLKAYLERVIAEAADAEFRAYQALPKIESGELDKWFYPESPAKKEIRNLLQRHKAKGWNLTNPLNPSTKRVLSIKIKKISPFETFVQTTEYWYLRWWNSRKGSYAYPYRETNRQIYVLRKDGGDWKVYENLRPSPRTSAPHRRIRN